MALLGTFGPVDGPNGHSTTGFTFLPVKPATTVTSLDMLNVGTGFIVSRSGGQESLSLAIPNGGGGVQLSSFRPTFSLAGADPNYPLYQYELMTPATATTADILVFRMDPSPSASTVQLFRATLPSGPFTEPAVPPQPLSSIAFGRPVLGIQVLPVPGGDRFGFLFDNGLPLDGDGTTAYDGGSQVFSTGASTGSTNIQFPGTQKRALFYNNGLTGAAYRSYASSCIGGQWVCYRWDATVTPAVLLSGITHRIDALLTNGNLISTEGGVLRMYDPGGVEVMSAGLGALQFCYEAYVGSTPYVFFSLTFGFGGNSWAYRVYTIPTSGMIGLKR